MTVEPWQELTRLHEANDRGSIEGIAFDFRHPEIGDDWKPGLAFGWNGRDLFDRDPSTPCLVFPWTSLPPYALINGDSNVHGRALMRRLARFDPDGWVGPGDRLSIRGVRQAGDPFEAEPNRTRHVRYLVTRATGRIERLRGKSVYVHRDSDWRTPPLSTDVPASGQRLCLETVERRVRALLGAADLDRHGRTTDLCDPDLALALLSVKLIHAEADQKTEVGRAVRELALFEAGYHLAKAEAFKHMRPYADRGLKAERRQRAGSNASSKKRSSPVRQAALADIEANPNTSQGQCAKRVAAALGKSDEGVVARTIAPFFEWRDFAGGAREKRPKPEFLLPGR